jgi:hypothetical protein
MVASYWTHDNENQGSMTGGGFLQQLNTFFLHIRTVHLDIIEVLFIHQLMH